MKIALSNSPTEGHGPHYRDVKLWVGQSLVEGHYFDKAEYEALAIVLSRSSCIPIPQLGGEVLDIVCQEWCGPELV